MSKKGGYKIVSLGGLDLIGEDLALEGLYNALKLSYGKPILLSGIVIDGEKMKDIYVVVDEDTDEILIKNIYGYNLTVDDEDAITVEENSENISLPIPSVEDDGKLLKVNVQGKYVLGSLIGQYVRIMDAPSSTTLTDEQRTTIEDGIFIKGNFLNMRNPILTPTYVRVGGQSYGMIMGNNPSNAYQEIGLYSINDINVISRFNGELISLTGVRELNGKVIPVYPSATGTFTLKSVNGVLTWVQDE